MKPGTEPTHFRIRYEYWRTFPTLKVWQAAAMMRNIDPDVLGDVVLRNPDPEFANDSAPVDLDEETRRLIGAALTGALVAFPHVPNAPDAATEISCVSFVLWVRGQGYGDLANGLGGVVAPAPVAQPKATPAWKALARTRAEDIVARQKAKDLFPSQTTVADQVATDFRKEGIYGEGGKPLTGSYIKRHALKGISSAAAKQRSTKPNQGK